MHTTSDARPIPFVTHPTVQVSLLGAVSFITLWMLYRAEWRSPLDPCVHASIACLITSSYLWLTRRRLPAPRFEPVLLAVFLAAMPLVYLLRYLFNPEPTAGPGLWIEILGLVIYASLAVLGLKRSPWFLAIGIALHGLAWDAWHFHAAFMPGWYPIACLSIDVTLGAYVATRIPAYANAVAARPPHGTRDVPDQ